MQEGEEGGKKSEILQRFFECVAMGHRIASATLFECLRESKSL
jgi:hypothetical protein